MKKHLTNLFLVLILFTGFSLLLYPTVSDYWNSMHQTRAIASYNDSVSELDHSEYDELLAQAQAYNETLLHNPTRFMMTDEERALYDSLLDISGIGIMGYIDIPKIECHLAIYHGTAESVLQVGVGHVEGSSLPTGGLGTHCVLSGHRGLPSAKLFTSLDQITEGDVFLIHVLDDVLTYEVDQILTVLPDELDALKIDPEKDYCTLVTCTPYGINSHRLLVRGHRIETQEIKEEIHVVADAVPISRARVASVITAPVVMLWLLFTLLRRKR